MKIAFIYLGQQGGGVSLDFLEYAIGLAQFANILCILSNKSDDYQKWVEKAETNSNMSIIGISTTKNALSGGIQMLNPIKFHNIRRQINRFSPDVVYSPMGHPWERIIIPFLKCKFTVKSIHDVKYHKGENTLFSKILRFLFSYDSSRYVVFSKYSKHELAKIKDDSRIWVLPLGCTLSLSHNRRFDQTYYGRFLFFGRLIEYKGIDILLKSLGKVFVSFPDVELVLAGRGDLSKYKDMMIKHKDHIKVHNKWIQNDEVDSFFRNIDFVVAPYVDATQSGVVPLSYVFGKPVIVSNSGGLPEQVSEGKTGLIVKQGDPDTLANAIISLYSNRNKLIEMKKYAYEFAEKNSWQFIAEKLIENIRRECKK